MTQGIGKQLIVAGSISMHDEIAASRNEVDAVGMAIYTGKMNLRTTGSELEQ